MKFSVGFKIGCMNAVAIIALVSLSLANYYSTNRMVETTDWRQHSYEVIGGLDTLLVSLIDAETGQRGYLITKQDHFLEPYRTALPLINDKLYRVKALTTDNEEQQRHIQELIPLIQNKLDNIQKSFNLTNVSTQSTSMDDGKKIMDTIRQIIATMKEEEKGLLASRVKSANDSVNQIFQIIIYGSLIAVLFLILLSLALIRSISKPLQAMTATAKILSTSVSEIFSSLSQLVASGNETSAAVTETTTTIEEVKQTSIIANQKANSVAENAQKVAQISESGKKSLHETNKDMMQIQGQMTSIAESMIRLSEQTQAISSIIETVDKLAQQSNLLAVNASIEAEKANEQGRGFRIVAQEIKNLADQSKQATHQVREILSDVQKATNTAVLATEEGSKVVETGVKKSEETSDSISLLSDNIAEAVETAIQIASSSRQQLIGVEQATIAMEQIKQATAHNVVVAKQLESAANSLKEMGIKLESLTDQYVV